MSYPKPPIVEAIIDIRCQEPISSKLLESVKEKFRQYYPFVEQRNQVALNVDGQQATVRQLVEGYKLATAEQTDVVLAALQGLASVRLAPYTGWEIFSRRARENWGEFKEQVGYRRISRIATRFINRLDVPGSNLQIEEWLAIGAQAPSTFPALTNYHTTITVPFEEQKCVALINTGTIPSPIVGHLSVLLDIDLVRAQDVPQQDDAIWALFSQMRALKNRIFEECITDRSRALFMN